MLSYPCFSQPFFLTRDASNDAPGGVLSPTKCDEEIPIPFASRILTKTGKNYSTIEKKLLAIVWGAQHFRTYLLGRNKIYTNNRRLKGVFNVKDPTTRLLRFHHELSEYVYEIEYKKGNLTTNADTLSRVSHPESKRGTFAILTRSQATKNNPDSKTEKAQEKVASPDLNVKNASPF